MAVGATPVEAVRLLLKSASFVDGVRALGSVATPVATRFQEVLFLLLNDAEAPVKAQGFAREFDLSQDELLQAFRAAISLTLLVDSASVLDVCVDAAGEGAQLGTEALEHLRAIIRTLLSDRSRLTDIRNHTARRAEIVSGFHPAWQRLSFRFFLPLESVEPTTSSLETVPLCVLTLNTVHGETPASLTFAVDSEELQRLIIALVAIHKRLEHLDAVMATGVEVTRLGPSEGERENHSSNSTE